MIYLTTDDLKVQVKTDQLNMITDNDQTVLDLANLAALKEMESYLRLRYDTSQIWNKVGEDRDQLLVLFMGDITLYHVHSRINPRNIPQLRMDRYDAAIAWLKGLAKGDFSADLPPATVDSSSVGASGEIRWGSNTKLGHGY